MTRFTDFSMRYASHFLRFSTGQQVLFVRRLSLYLHSGIPISRALAFIIADTPTRSIAFILKSLEETVGAGMLLSQGMEKFPKQFNSFSIGFVKAGETSGTLSDTLARLAVALAKREALRRKILSALAYPALILLGTIGITLFLTLFIFPKIIPVLKGFRTTLPFTTRALIAINALAANYWAFILGGLVLASIACSICFRFRGIRASFEKALFWIPLFSSLYQYYAIANFSRSLSLQLRGGVRILPALMLLQTSLPGILYPDALIRIEQDVSSGHRLSAGLRKHARLFPSLVCQMVAAGEETGTLGANLETLADSYEESLDELTKNLTVLIEPVLMIVMGCIVGFVALAIITPIYSVTQNLNIK